MKGLCIITTAVLLAAPAAAVDPPITAALKVAAAQDETLSPYRLAELSAGNGASATVEAVLLRPVGGGPTVRCAFALPPGQESTRRVPLPALWPVQMYRITALDAAGKPLGVAAAEITWAELATTDQFIDDAFAAFADAPVTWPARSRRNAVLLLAIFATAAAGTLLVRRPWARAAAALILMAAATALAFYVPAWPASVEAAEYHLHMYPQSGPVKLDTFAVLAARRTSAVQRKAHRVPHPVYPDREAAAKDKAEVNPAERAIRLTVRRGQVRVLRPARIGARFTKLDGADSTVQEVGGVLYVEGGVPLRPAFVVRDDSAWALDAPAPAEPIALRPEESRSVWQVLSRARQRPLRLEHVRLFRYWRQKYQRAETLYVLGFQRRASHFLLAVIEMKLISATQPSPTRLGQPGG